MPPPRYATELERVEAEIVVLGARQAQLERELVAARERIVVLETKTTDLRREVDRIDAEVTALDADVHDSDVRHVETRGVLTSLAEGTERQRKAEEAAAKLAMEQRVAAEKLEEDRRRDRRNQWRGFALALLGTAIAGIASAVWHWLTRR